MDITGVKAHSSCTLDIAFRIISYHECLFWIQPLIPDQDTVELLIRLFLQD